MPTVELPYAYEVEIRPARSRRAWPWIVRDAATFKVPEASIDEMPLAFTVDDGREPLRMFDGRLYKPVVAREKAGLRHLDFAEFQADCLERSRFLVSVLGTAGRRWSCFDNFPLLPVLAGHGPEREHPLNWPTLAEALKGAASEARPLPRA